MAWPPSVGDGLTDGSTVFTKAFWDAYDAEVEDALVDTTSGGGAGSNQTPAETTAEVVDARGSLPSISKRIGGVIDSDGNPIGVVSPSMLRNGFVYGNLTFNGDGLSWSRGGAAAPDGWALAGAGAAVAQCGVGMTDTVSAETNSRSFAARVTAAAVPGVLAQRVLNADMVAGRFSNTRALPVDASGNIVPGYSDPDDKYLFAWYSEWVFCDATNRARLLIGESSMSAAIGSASPYHPGDSAWHLLVAGPYSDPDGLSSIIIQRRAETAGAAYFQGASVHLAPAGFAPLWLPTRWRYRTAALPYIDNPATGVIGYVPFARPVFIIGAQMLCVTAGGGSQATVDLLTPISGTFQSMFATLPTIAAAKLTGVLQACDPAAANYRRRTIRGCHTAGDSALPDNSLMRVDYVDDGSATLRGLTVVIHYLEPETPFDQLLSMGELGET